MDQRYDFKTQEPENYEQKTLCCLVVDVSGSMQGQPINQLNRGLQQFHQEIREHSMTANRLEVALVTFNSTVDTLVQPDMVYNFSMPQLAASGTTRLVDGVVEAIQIVETRKNWYKQTGQPHLRPWIVLITDGAPDPGQDVDGLAREINIQVQNKRFVFFALGVEGADMAMLQHISTPQMPPSKLEGTRFIEFFQWLSNSMEKVSSSREGDRLTLDSPAKWMEGFDVQ